MRRAAPVHIALGHFDAAKTCKIQCADKPLRPKGASERQFALSRLPNRADKVNSFLRVSPNLRPSLLPSTTHKLHHSRDRDVIHQAGSMRSFAFGTWAVACSSSGS